MIATETNRGIPFEPLLGGSSVRFDPLKLVFIEIVALTKKALGH